MRLLLRSVVLVALLVSCKSRTMNQPPKHLFADALVSEKPSEELVAYADYYEWLIGGWDVKAIDYLAPDQKMETIGEWYFSWTLEGRAVQDVWIAPKRELRNKETSKVRNRYGSTIRTFDAVTKQWKLYWFNPVSGAMDMLVAKKDGNDIVQVGVDSEGNQMRWVFTDITVNSFRWYGERSADGGKTWNLEAEFFGTKMM